MSEQLAESLKSSLIELKYLKNSKIILEITPPPPEEDDYYYNH